MRLANKVAIITGAGSGLGRGSAILFAREGAKIAVADINDAGGKDTVKAIKSAGGEAIFVHTDVSKAAEVKNLVKVTKDAFGKIDILFNNAGIPQRTMPITEVDEADWDRVFAVNVKSVFLTAKYASPVMKGSGGGSIINLASISGVRPRPGNLAYASSKAAVILLTKALALEFAPHIRVNVINPVAADTPMLPKFFPAGADVEEFKKKTLATIPMGRLTTPEDIGYAALFLASDESSLVTGSALDVDGGRGI
ncbi:MAG TPA: glucose 1-dehydrogenase [Dehalococcoidales bacterium]|nr:MAG: 3-oxoacyl-ACP reductase [Chloroflexi bacterium RBG_16_60_22]HJX14071.1 glucose 1-dehydrogenase [Dehalococcoidales bacterium]